MMNSTLQAQKRQAKLVMYKGFENYHHLKDASINTCVTWLLCFDEGTAHLMSEKSVTAAMFSFELI